MEPPAGAPQPPELIEDREEAILEDGVVEFEACRRSALYFLEHYVWTVDEHEREEPEKPLLHGEPCLDPVTLQVARDLDGSRDDYLRYTALMWEHEDLLLVPKSRQLRLTHLFINLHRWLCEFHEGQRVAIQSKKFEDADELLKRAKKSLEIARDRFPFIPWPEFSYKEGRITFPHGSVMMAVAQGPDVLRQYTFSAIFSDEMAFQEEAESAYTASIPTIEDGGKFTGVSSADPGYFHDLVFDQTHTM